MAWAALGKKLATGAVKSKAKKITADKLLNRKKKKPAAKRPSLDELIADVRGSGPETDQAKGGALVVRPTTSLVPSPGGAIQKHTGIDGEYGSVEDNIIRIKSKVIAVDGILKGTLAAEKARKKDAAAAQEAAEQAAAEKKLEKPKAKKKKKGGGFKAPKQIVSLWEKLKNFFTTIVFGYVGMKLIPLLPKLLPIAVGLMKGLDFFIAGAGWLLNIGVTIIDWGYKLYDMGMTFIKNIVGEENMKYVDTFMEGLNSLMNGFFMWKIFGKKIFEQVLANIKRTFRIAKVIIKRIVKFAKSFIKNAINLAKNIAKNIMKIPGVKNVVSKVAQVGGNILKAGGNILSKGKGLLGNIAGKGGGVAAKVAGKAGGLAAKFLGPAAKALGPVMKVVGPGIKKFASRIPILGPIIVAVVSIMSGDSLAQALFKGVGAALGGALGATLAAALTTATVGIGALLAPAMTMLGELLGTFVGDLLFELFMGGGMKAAFEKLKGALGGIWKGIFNAGKAIFEFFRNGFAKFIETFPMVKFPEASIGTMLANVLSINPIYKAVLNFKVPDWKVIPKAIRGFSLSAMLSTLPSIPEILGWIFNLHPLLKMLVKDGKVEGFPAIWQLFNPAFMVKHMASSFFGVGKEEGKKETVAKTPPDNLKEGKGGDDLKEAEKQRKAEEKARKKAEAKKKREEIKAKVGETISNVKDKVGGFFKNIGQGIKDIAGKAVEKHPAVQAGKAIKNALSDPIKEKGANNIVPIDTKAVSKKADDVSEYASYEDGASSTIIINTEQPPLESPDQKRKEDGDMSSSAVSADDPYEVLDLYG